jgi:Leucine-rich repeat (LRR) protein
VSDTGLAGMLPAAFSALTLLESLESLDTSNNLLSGTLPAAFSVLTLLKSLDTSNNLLSGTLPAAFSALTLLEVLDMSHNMLALAERFPVSLPNVGVNGSCNMRDQCDKLRCHQNTQAGFCGHFSAKGEWIK